MLYIKPQLFALLETGSVGDLRAAVQAAIEIEHATMPPYLYALYSLGTSNPVLRATIRAIVQDEMLHMLLACNLLNAIGGSPLIDSPAFAPDYPTVLPGSVNGSLIIPLAPLSIALLENVFMEIEEPETPLNFPIAALDAFVVTPAGTIGQYYNRIKERLVDAGDGIFTGDPVRQVTSPHFSFPEADQRITNLSTAINAIDHIVQQGEGTSESPNLNGGGLAHYYRFAEVVRGRKLIPNPNATPTTPPSERYIYGGSPVLIQPGVLPLLENPKSEVYPVGSPARVASDEFNRIYTEVLGLLHSTFNGAVEHMVTATARMKDEMKPAAQNLTNIVLDDGSRAGPSFEYLR